MRQRLWNLLAGFCGSLGSSWGKVTTLEILSLGIEIAVELSPANCHPKGGHRLFYSPVGLTPHANPIPKKGRLDHREMAK